MPAPGGDVTALFLGPPGSGKSRLIRALRRPDTREPDTGVPSLFPAGPGLFLGELSCPPNAPGPWAAQADVLVLVLPGGPGEELAEAGRAALARGTPVLAVLTLGLQDGEEGEDEEETRARGQLATAGLDSIPTFVLAGAQPRGAQWAALRAALETEVAALERVLPPAQEGFEVLGEEELAAVREAFEAGGLEAVLSWVRASLERLGSAQVDLGVVGEGAGAVLDALRGLGEGDEGAAPAEPPPRPVPYPVPDHPNVVLWALPAGPPEDAHPRCHAVVLVSPGPPGPEEVAQGQVLSEAGTPCFHVRTDGVGPGPGGGPEGPDDESWEVLGGEDPEPPPTAFPLHPGGLPGLQEALRRALAPAQATALLLALPPASPTGARDKAEALRGQAWRPALLASLAATAPVPGLGWACDVALLRGQLAEYLRELGLEPGVLARRERALGLPPGTLAALARSALSHGATREAVEERLRGWAGEGRAGGVLLGALGFLFPMGGAVATGGLGYRAAHGVLSQGLAELQADAEAVLGAHPEAPES
ncbi:immunity-related GTPase family Q protein [Tachyglossus aculeatus]|uniref:immunity-related GTPase family Q protein n=1 Tax=Tachyglossus aculeatus TaxID=9261 RepID=UPI0018F626D6|nr:immunity-related GTPase family Q protein [Tachyglossus aculeatus]